MASIVTLTVNPTIDKSSAVESVASEIKLRCEMPEFHPGGGGINVSRAIKKLGGDSTAIYSAGGGVGEMLTNLLQAEHIQTKPIAIAGLTRENLTIYEKTSGLQYRFGMPGPNIENWQVFIDETLAQEADYIVASGSLAGAMPETFYQDLARQVHETDSKLIVDTSGAALQACAQAGVYLLKPNLRELEILSGEQFETEDKLITVVQGLIQDGMAEVFVISMGSAGAMLIDRQQTVCVRPPVVPIASKVGAGDSMVGGMVWSLSRGDDLVTAVRYGIAAGSAAVMTPGTELCRADDVHQIFERVSILR